MAQEYITLAAGNKMPIFGLGTWAGQVGQAPEEGEVRKAVEAALDSGYKLIDTAYYYRNEHVIGQVIKERIAKGGMKREDIFITTKLGLISLGSRERVRECIDICLKRLQMGYVDLFLIHGPVAFKYYGPDNLWPMKDGKLETEHADLVKCWQYMEEVVDQGKAKAIGVSNFTKEQIDRIRKVARIPISNQQVELNAYFQQKDLAKFCQERNISVTAYAPIGSPGSMAERTRGGAATSEAVKVPMTDPLILELAKKYNKAPAQILLRNLIQRGIAVVPKSVTPSRIQANIQVFDFKLTDGEMDAIAKIDTGKRQFMQKELSYHPEYPWHDE